VIGEIVKVREQLLAAAACVPPHPQ